MSWTLSLLLLGCACVAVAYRPENGEILGKLSDKFPGYHCVVPSDDIEEDYKNFLKCYFPNYKPDGSHVLRKAKFMECRDAMLNWNAAKAGWSIGITQFCHMTDQEVNRTMNWMLASPLEDDGGALFDEELHKLPMPKAAIIDYAAAGKVTSIKNQGSCGSCYAFGTVATIESYVAIKYNRLVDLSPQQYLDCSSGAGGNQGCGGGFAENCYNYNLKTAKQQSWSCYPYYGYQTSCRHSVACSTQQGITGHYRVANYDETAMANALQKYGPLTVALDQSGMQRYTGGVFDGSCSTQQNHLVALVGYGTDNATGKAYWLFKNSYGTGWGEKGYGRIARGKNKCGIAGHVNYAIIP